MDSGIVFYFDQDDVSIAFQDTVEAFTFGPGVRQWLEGFLGCMGCHKILESIREVQKTLSRGPFRVRGFLRRQLRL